MILLEFDLAGADWIVTAYASGCEQMIKVAESGRSPHPITGSLISGAPEELVMREHKLLEHETDPDKIAALRQQLPELASGQFFLPRSMSIRQAGKKSNHGLNYDMKYKRFALENEIPETDAKRICEAYIRDAYPGIPRWHEEIREQLKRDRTLVNPFGRKVRLLEQWGEDLFKAGYSFIPQSTVFDITRRAMILAYRDWSPLFEPMEILGQVHDSILFQYPERDLTAAAVFSMTIALNYMRPEIELRGRPFRLNVDAKTGYRWGNSMQGFSITESVEETRWSLQKALELSVESHAASSDPKDHQTLSEPESDLAAESAEA